MNLRSMNRGWAGIAVLLGLSAATATAQPNTALDFDGVNDYVQIGDPLSLTGPLTFEAWVLVRSATGPSSILSNRFNTGYLFDIWDNGATVQLRLIFDCCTRGAADFAPYMNTWTHVAATWDGTATDLYINGTRVGGGTYFGPNSPSTTNLTLGLRQFSSYFDGGMDEVRIWSAKLDQVTIQTWMSKVLTNAHPDYASLEANWRFNEGAGESVASEVGSAALEGRLGSTSSADDSDPLWIGSGATPVRTTSMARIKGLYGQ